MNKLIFVLLFVLLCNGLNAQRKLGSSGASRERLDPQDTISRGSSSRFGSKSNKKLETKIQDYLIISHKNDTTFVDTTLTIQKEYKFNYLRKDNFGLMPFSNLGQTYNSLTYNFENTSLMPGFGARARHFNYMEIEDINYYRVPTPLTELMFKTAFEQGQLADSFFSVNTSPQFNFSIAYKGLRSLGKYQHVLTSTGNFRFTTNYRTKNNRYNVRGHIVTQDLLNQENGGIIDDNIDEFETGDPEFIDRSIFEVNFENAESILRGKRFHLEHNYKIIREKDSLSNNKLSIGHIISFEDKYFQYDQTTANTSFFGDAFKTIGLKDRATLENFYNQVQLNYSNNIIGNLQFNISNTNYNYGYDKLVVLNGNTITNRLKGDVFSAGGKYQKQYKGFDLQGEMGLNISGDFDGNYIKAKATFKLNEDIAASASLNHSSRAPNYNTLLYQSDYINYNWQNSFNNIETQQLAFNLKYKQLLNVSVDLNTINDYVYFKQDENTNQVKPFQNNNSITYLRVKLENEIKFGKFALNNTILYQNVQDENNVLNVPELTTRNTLYFSSHLFKKAMYLQTGVTLNYFTQYYMNDYSPVLAEFYVQNEREFGSFPRLDFFINAKIRQTRIYLKAEHFNSAFTGYNYYSAPNYPYRDFTVRFGVVWNFFL
ncbi:putative porin [Sabulilitoribacter multivorans]|uniref:Porin n=1 Tax=Flaviramulus multivorans TaxID=1304750 RepID=A0ABS9IK30_9FLAO|nr:putative porin [Flaviramulus multivorans]MCF7560954.1 putative porin [Flaviramulus multivorans]